MDTSIIFAGFGFHSIFIDAPDFINWDLPYLHFFHKNILTKVTRIFKRKIIKKWLCYFNGGYGIMDVYGSNEQQF